MIDTSLNKKYEAAEAPNMDFSPLPDGDYTVRVKEIEPWKETVKSLKVNILDEKGRPTKDPNGNNITTAIDNCHFFSCNMKLEVVGGEYDGRTIFDSLTTHPNMPWSIPRFLNGVGLKELSASDIQRVCVGKMMIVTTKIDEYTKDVIDSKTGLTEKKVKQINRVRGIKPLENNTENVSNTDMSQYGL